MSASPSRHYVRYVNAVNGRPSETKLNEILALHLGHLCRSDGPLYLQEHTM
jgi:hypothetical protein